MVIVLSGTYSYTELHYYLINVLVQFNLDDRANYLCRRQRCTFSYFVLIVAYNNYRYHGLSIPRLFFYFLPVHIKAMMYVDEANYVCQVCSRWKSVASTYPYEKKTRRICTINILHAVPVLKHFCLPTVIVPRL